MKPRRRRSQTIPLAAVHTDAIGWGPSGSVQVLDQTVLPGDVRYLELQTVDAMVEAVRVLRVRGAPLIGIAAAMGLAAEAEQRALAAGLTPVWLDAAASLLASARPTAVNLAWAVERMRRGGEQAVAPADPAAPGGQPRAA